MKQYLAFDIGCIECGEPSKPIGLFETEADAHEACDRERENNREESFSSHSYEVFEIE